MKNIAKTLFPVFSLVLLSLITFGQEKPTEDTQIWSDVQLTFHVSKKIDTYLNGTFRLGRNVNHPIDERIGGGLTFKPNKYFSIGASYSYIAQQPLENVKKYENRVNAAVTVSYPVGKSMISDRNQVERRFLSSRADTWRYRNRIQIEHTFSKGDFKFNLYATDEVFYDSGAEAWTRNRFLIGFTHKVSPRYTLDIYSGRQNDGFVNPGNWNIIGVAMRISIN